MKKVKLSELKDAETFFRAKNSKVEWEIVERLTGGMTSISATKSGKTTHIKTTSEVYQKEP